VAGYVEGDGWVGGAKSGAGEVKFGAVGWLNMELGG
jgi:hypothetical protein